MMNSTVKQIVSPQKHFSREREFILKYFGKSNRISMGFYADLLFLYVIIWFYDIFSMLESTINTKNFGFSKMFLKLKCELATHLKLP